MRFSRRNISSMNIIFDYSSTTGWHEFTGSSALTEALWEHLDLLSWHYMNFTSDTSIWESKEDGSVLFVAYDQLMVVELSAEKGNAEQAFDPIAALFGLKKSNPEMSPTE
jgi:hypothetical protein